MEWREDQSGFRSKVLILLDEKIVLQSGRWNHGIAQLDSPRKDNRIAGIHFGTSGLGLKRRRISEQWVFIDVVVLSHHGRYYYQSPAAEHSAPNPLLPVLHFAPLH